MSAQAAFAERSLDLNSLELQVMDMYQKVANEPEGAYHFEMGRGLARRLGYAIDDLNQIPAAAIESFAGVGYTFDLADIQPGESVVDLGSGSGTDSFIAARKVGDTGAVLGIDMTDGQLAKATRLCDEGGYDRVYFHKGYIESLPVGDACVDAVISNGVINLSPDKAAVFAEASRVLKPGGRLTIADIVTTSPLPEGVTCNADLWAACIGGAMQIEELQDAIEAAGLSVRYIRHNEAYRFVSESARNATDTWGVKSISLLAVKAA